MNEDFFLTDLWWGMFEVGILEFTINPLVPKVIIFCQIGWKFTIKVFLGQIINVQNFILFE